MARILALLICALPAAAQVDGLGAQFSWPGIAGAATDADIAYDATTGVFLVVWEEFDANGSGERHILGQRVDTGGNLVGGTIVIEAPDNGIDAYAPKVANVNSRDRFVVMWREDVLVCRLRAVTVSAATGAQGTPVSVDFVPCASVVKQWHDLSGDVGTQGTAAIGVWYDTLGFLVSQRLVVGATGNITISGLALVDTAPATHVSISNSGGVAGRHLVAWEKEGNVRMAIFNRSLNRIDEGVLAGSPETEAAPSVDGDGSKWMVAFRSGDLPDSEIDCVSVFWNTERNRTWKTPAQVASPVPGVRAPTVVFLGDTYLLGFETATERYVRTVDYFNCIPCEPLASVGTFSSSVLRIGSVRSGDPTANDLALVSSNEKTGRLYTAVDGQVEELGGGCGRGGNPSASCARIGYGTFELAVWDARSSTPAFLMLAASRADFSCGGCTLIPNLGAGIVVPAGPTDALGNASIVTALPNDPALIGGLLYEQWLLLAGSGCLGQLETSDALRVTIE